MTATWVLIITLAYPSGMFGGLTLSTPTHHKFATENECVAVGTAWILQGLDEIRTRSFRCEMERGA